MKREMEPRKPLTTWLLSIGLTATLLPGCAGEMTADEAAAENAAEDLPRIELEETPAFPLDDHLESADIAAGEMSFTELFAAGRKLFHTAFNGLDGVGMARLPNGEPLHRFTMVPPGGILLPPASQSCGGCHAIPFPAGAGLSQTHVVQDLDADGEGPFNTRSTTSLFGDGILQLLAQEITEDLQAVREEAAAAAREKPGASVRRELASKGISYGAIAATAGNDGTVSFDLSEVDGVDPDLVVRPIGWKGNLATVRTIVMGAASVGMGMQAEEFVWKAPGGAEADPDADGVERELSVGDVTAMTVYNAALPTPQELGRLADLGHVAAPSAEESARIEQGRAVFAEIGCAGCHVPELRLEETTFEEPTARGNGHYHDHLLADDDEDYDPERPVRFDLLTDARPPRAEAHPEGGAVIRLYGDLRRHAMGRVLADPGGPTPALVPEFAPLEHDGEVVLIAPDVFLTAELWGVGNTGPWLHDGRAGTLREAISFHGEDDPPPAGAAGRSEAQEARDGFVGLPEEEQADLIAFLLSLRTFAPEED